MFGAQLLSPLAVIFLSLYARTTNAASTTLAAAATSTIAVIIPSAPQSTRQVVGPMFQSFSIEFNNFFDYTGNASYVNELSVNLVANLRKIGKTPIRVRVGGATQKIAKWVPTLDVGLESQWASSTPGPLDEPLAVYVGPAFADCFHVWPKDTVYTVGLPFSFSTYSYLADARGIIKNVFDSIGDQYLHSIELGNEQGNANRLPGYVDHFFGYSQNISQYLWGVPNKKIYQIGDFVQPKCVNALTCATTQTLLNLGINNNNTVKQASTHQYMGTAADNSTDAQYLLSHSNTVSNLAKQLVLADDAKSRNVPYFLGETNSLSGHGKLGVSDTFAAALWTLDYVFYAAQTNISRVYLHQGTGWKYSAWNPIEMFDYEAGVMGAYYSFFFTASALAGSNKQVELLYASNLFTVYGIYNNDTSKLESVVALNLQAWMAGTAARPSVVVDLPSSIGNNFTVRRLTAPGADVKWGITFSGQGIDSKGKINGTYSSEKVTDGTVRVAASEAVLIYPN